MKNSDDSPTWNEAALESLLSEFFEREMPAEFQRPRSVSSPRARLVSADSEPRDRASRPGSLSGTAGLVMAASCLAMLVLLTVGTRGRDGGEAIRHFSPGEIISKSHEVDSSEAALATEDSPASRPGSAVARGPVEQQGARGTTPVSASGNGEDVENDLPELSIEIIPIDGNDRTAPPNR